MAKVKVGVKAGDRKKGEGVDTTVGPRKAKVGGGGGNGGDGGEATPGSGDTTQPTAVPTGVSPPTVPPPRPGARGGRKGLSPSDTAPTDEAIFPPGKEAAGSGGRGGDIVDVGADGLSPPPPSPTVGPTREMELLNRRYRVARMYMEGRPQHEIAAVVGVTDGVVAADLGRIREEWRKLSLLGIQERTEQELAKLDHVEAVAWEAWGRSCKDGEVVTERTESARVSVKGGKAPQHILVPTRTVQERTVRGSSGDPRFLDRIAWCVETRLKMLGLLKGDRVSVNTVMVNWDALVTVKQQSSTTPGPGSDVHAGINEGREETRNAGERGTREAGDTRNQQETRETRDTGERPAIGYSPQESGGGVLSDGDPIEEAIAAVERKDARIRTGEATALGDGR